MKNVITTTCNIGIFNVIKYYKKTKSTQIILKNFANSGYKEGLVVVAEQQTMGYGRNGNTWSSSIGGAWFSILLKPKINPRDTKDLLILLSIAIKNILEKIYHLDCEMKWPNDVLIYGKKIAGSMIEMEIEETTKEIKWAVAGIGINVNNDLPEELLATAISLKRVIKQTINIYDIIIYFISEFTNLYTRFQKSHQIK
ncbi:MAG: biotin--[acetyl-CoA-carboxylase] ligase [Endomicrobium sp.]|jgi:BirA family biotin operon repressor/biotin-[acetyl-CoA-carboxylase] ligase|nr:biotin--[acetyl-CoA-carboxylase] ligase [Endomicrobium sp.]